MPQTLNSVNPTSTSTAFAPNFRGEAQNTFTVTLPTTAGAAVSLPKVEHFPATFWVVPDGARTLKTAYGFITLLRATELQVHGNGTGFSTSASTTADHVVISNSSGVITITNAGTNAATAATTYSVIRIG